MIRTDWLIVHLDDAAVVGEPNVRGARKVQNVCMIGEIAPKNKALQVRATCAAIESLLKLDGFSPKILRHPNFWDIIEYGVGSYEVRYSRMFRWLLDPNGSHKLGDYFAKQLLALADLRSPYDREKERSEFGSFEIDYSATVVQMEWNHIDILLNDGKNKQVIVIENKMFSGEHNALGTEKSQLTVYRDIVKQSEEFSDYDRMVFVYLTGTGELPSDGNDDWIPICYKDLEPALEGAILRSRWRQDVDTTKIIEDFYHDQKRQFASDIRQEIADILYENWSKGAREQDIEYNLFEEFSALGRALGVITDSVEDDDHADEISLEVTSTQDDRRFLEEVRFELENCQTQIETRDFSNMQELLNAVVSEVWDLQPTFSDRENKDIHDLIVDIFNELVVLEDAINYETRARRQGRVRPEYRDCFEVVERQSRTGLGMLLIAESKEPDRGFYFAGSARGLVPAVFSAWKAETKDLNLLTKKYLKQHRAAEVLSDQKDRSGKEWAEVIVSVVRDFNDSTEKR